MQRSSLKSKNVLTTSTPGAQASTQPPQLENHARPPAPTAPMPLTSLSPAGKYGRHVAWLPAAATPNLSPSSCTRLDPKIPGSSSAKNAPKLITTMSIGAVVAASPFCRPAITSDTSPSPKLDNTPAVWISASGHS